MSQSFVWYVSPVMTAGEVKANARYYMRTVKDRAKKKSYHLCGSDSSTTDDFTKQN